MADIVESDDILFRLYRYDGEGALALIEGAAAEIERLRKRVAKLEQEREDATLTLREKSS